MKDLQWFVAVGVLAVVVFVVVFTGQFLGVGNTPSGSRTVEPDRKKSRNDQEITFLYRSLPHTETPFEIEHHDLGEASFLFVNESGSRVVVGLERSSCKCTEAEIYILADAPRWISGLMVQQIGLGIQGGFPLAIAHRAAELALKKAAEPHELKRDKELVEVPPGAGGWVRLAWKGDKLGSMTQYATLFMNNILIGRKVTLDIRSFIHEPIRYRPSENLGVLRESDLAKGVTREVIVWSSTRPSFRVTARMDSLRSDAKADPIEVGEPVPLTSAERAELERLNNAPSEFAKPGRVLSAYRIPLTLRSMAADGKTPFPIGPFRRKLLITSPDLPTMDTGAISLNGQVRGLVEIGSEEIQGMVTFGSFPSKRGRSEVVNLSSDVAGIELSVDTSRTAPFLVASLSEPQKAGETRQLWKLRLEIKPGAAVGSFPRRDDPRYEDSAVYLLAKPPGQPVRPIRIAIQGTATGS
ncbi:MAG: hypothetical protein SNJ75_18010 [Gemmataceae bacterium]